MVVLGFQDAAKWVFAAGSGGTGIANDVLLGMCDGCPTSGHHARTQRRRQRVHYAYGTQTGCCTGTHPEIPRKTTTMVRTARARSTVGNANMGRATMCGRFGRLQRLMEGGAPLGGAEMDKRYCLLPRHAGLP